MTYFWYKENGKKYFPTTAAAVITGNLSTPFLKEKFYNLGGECFHDKSV